jgi:GT2 family glycosyltransferase
MSKDLPRVSVVTLNWNTLDDTIECVESLQKVTYPNFEVIVVDNGSDGNEGQILAERFEGFIRLIQNDMNYGFAKGCNIGMADALERGTDHCLLLNNDTVVAPDFLDKMMEVALSDDKIGITGGKIYTYSDPDRIWFAGGLVKVGNETIDFRQAPKDEGQFEEVVECGWIIGCLMLISREVLETVGMFDEKYFFGGEDLDLCMKAEKQGYRIVWAPHSKIWHKEFLASGAKRARILQLPMFYMFDIPRIKTTAYEFVRTRSDKELWMDPDDFPESIDHSG